jgi:tetratricopeptide (TPR) repeat protein
MRSRILRSLVILFVLYFTLSPPVAVACGPSTLEAVFVFTVHPGYPLERFARGQIGVVQPSFARSYLYVTYKYLNGGGFSPREQRMLTELWKDRLAYGWTLNEDEWVDSWLTARKKVPGLAEPAEIRVYRNREEPNQYETYLNCQKDAFDSAISTLNKRSSKYGVESPALRDWVTAQDQVFSNCGGGQQLPSPPTGSEDPLLRADREYQIAAASFYATKFDEAARRFDAIATDENSAWRAVAPYLAARSLVRKASLSAIENKSESLTQAETRLNKILADQKFASAHAASARLFDLVRLRLHPSDRLLELAKKLRVERDIPSLKQDLWDYTMLLDGFLETSQEEKKNFEAKARNDDLTDWIYTIQSSSPKELDHSFAQWRATHSLAWLVACLSKLKGTHTQAPEFISQALVVKPDSSAFASAQFHVVRLMIESGKQDFARAILDQLLKVHPQKFDETSLNLLLSQRMSLATSVADLLNFVPRFPAALSWNDDGREIPSEPSEIPPEMKRLTGKQFFDFDAVSAFNRHLPLTLLKEAVKSSALPVHLRRDLAQATWLRAVILDDFKSADEIVQILKPLIPQMAPALNEFVTTEQPAAKKFLGIYTWLKIPGLEPVVDQGIGRETELPTRDLLRDNWWCSAAISSTPEITAEEDDAPTSYTAEGDKAPAFLSPAETESAARENSALKALGAGPNYISRQVIDWANRNPKDPRVPEALHLAVYTTRYGCTDKATARWSKAAYDVLHRKYPNSTWAKKTKYWFKD